MLRVIRNSLVLKKKNGYCAPPKKQSTSNEKVGKSMQCWDGYHNFVISKCGGEWGWGKGKDGLHVN